MKTDEWGQREANQEDQIQIWLFVPLPVAVVADMGALASMLVVGPFFERKWSTANARAINTPSVVSNVWTAQGWLGTQWVLHQH